VGEGNVATKVNFTFWDTYGWNPNMTNVPHTIFNVLDHQEAILLEQVGAKPFKGRAYFTASFFGRNFKPILYNDSPSTSGFPEKKDGDSVEGLKIINDFRKFK